MITNTTNLDSKYQALFEEIATASNGEIVVNNIEEFFGNIIQISNLDLKFLRLPLDEPLFEIDANSRKINVDATPFKTNGLSVQGDNLAETIFFKINRYFDYKDLMNTKILINWKNGSESGSDESFVKSADIEPGYIVFGWGITDRITNKSGTVNFAICFEDESGYSFNTLPASLSIKDGLILVDPVVYNMESNIRAILTNSKFGEGDAAVNEVVWVTGDGKGLVKNNLDAEFVEKINLVVDLNSDPTAPQSLPINLYAVATCGRDADTINYYDKNKGTDLISVDYIEVDDDVESLNANVIYYVKESASGVTSYRPATEEELSNWSDIDLRVALYVKAAICVANEIGEYLVYAQGTKTIQNVQDDGTTIIQKIGSSSVSSSSIVVIPEPKAPVNVSIQNDNSIELDGYTFKENGNIYLADGSEINLVASAEFDEDGYGLVAFEWSSADGQKLEDTLAFEDAVTDTLTISAPGVYNVNVYNYRNNKALSELPYASASCTVSALASKFVEKEDGSAIAVNSKDGKISISAAYYPLTVTYALPENAYSSSIVCELEEGEKSEDGYVFNGKLVRGFNPIYADGKVTAKLYPEGLNDGGEYRVKLSNVYEGSVYSAYSESFTIDI